MSYALIFAENVSSLPFAPHPKAAFVFRRKAAADAAAVGLNLAMVQTALVAYFDQEQQTAKCVVVKVEGAIAVGDFMVKQDGIYSKVP